MRPRSIVLFERLYLAAFALGLAVTAESWTTRQRLLASAEGGEALAWLAPAASAVGVGIALLLWWFTARRPSIVAKWVIVVLAGYGLILAAVLLFGLLSGRGEPASVVLALLQNGLYVGAATQLFRPDARAWFGEEPVEVEP